MEKEEPGQTPEADPQPDPEQESQPEQIPDPTPEGTDGTSVYVRKLNSRAKKAEREAAQLREEKIRLEERLRAFDDTKKEQPKEKIYSPEEVQGFVDSGQLKPAIAAAYLAKVEVQQALAAQEEKHQREIPVNQARSRISEYVKLIPSLQDNTSDAYQKCAAEFNDLTAQGYPSDDRTRALAIKLAHGDLSMLQKRAAVRDNQSPARLPVDGGGGGGNGTKATDIAHAPDHLKEYWQKAGLNKDEQKRHFERWSAGQNKK